MSVEVCLPSRDWRRNGCSVTKSANKRRRLPCNVRTKPRVAFDSRSCYHFRLVRGTIGEISVNKPGEILGALSPRTWHVFQARCAQQNHQIA